MCLRWKLLILLLSFALVPTIVMTVFSNRLTIRRSKELRERAQATLIGHTEQRLELLVSSQASLMGHMRQIFELVLQLQAEEVEKALASTPNSNDKAYFSEDYDAGIVPGELIKSEQYAFRESNETRTLLSISTTNQVFTHPASVQRLSVIEDAQRLASISTVIRALKQRIPDALYWQYTSLESGLHSCYPGHGGYASDFDPRERSWYRGALAENHSVWTTPYIDASSNRLVLTARQPVYRPDGSLAGVTALDVSVDDLMNRCRIGEIEDAQLKMVVMVDRDQFTPGVVPMNDPSAMDLDDIGLFVVVESEDNPQRDPMSKPHFLESKDRSQFTAMLRDMRAGKSGARRLSFEGQPSIWAYGPSWRSRAQLIAIVPEEVVRAEANRVDQVMEHHIYQQLQWTFVVLVVVVLIVFLMTFVGSRTVTRPIAELSHVARQIAEGNLDVKAQVHCGDEISELGNAFNAMIPQLRDRMEMRHSLALAMEVQQHLLPGASPKVDFLDIAGKSEYCDETGGDYFDFVYLEEFSPHEIGIAVGDVTGHGVAAALMMTGARALLRSRAGQPGNIGDLLSGLNRHLTADTPDGRFMTMFYMKIDVSQKCMHWGSAGHDPAITYRPDTDTFKDLETDGIPLGIEENWPYREMRRDGLHVGEIIVIGTDGIWEAHDASDEQFGKERLKEIIRQYAHTTASEIGDAILKAVHDFRAEIPQEDDITFVVIRVTDDAVAEVIQSS